MDQGNTTISTQGGVEIVLKGFITGRQAEALTRVAQEKTPEDTNIARLHAAIEMVVVSVAGSSENILERILDLPFSDYQAVSDKIGEIALGKKKEVNTPQT